MTARRKEQRTIAWQPAVLVAVIASALLATAAAYNGTFRAYVPVTVIADRSGLVLETGAKVKLRGVDVGRVGRIDQAHERATITLEIDPDQLQYIPANVGAKINVTTVFGAKYVDLLYPEHPTSQTLVADTVLRSDRVTVEVNTVFENIVDLLQMIQPEKLNAVLSAVADAVSGRGQRIGESVTGLNEVLLALNARSDSLRDDWRALRGFNDAYAGAADDLVAVLDAVTTTSATIAKRENSLEALLLSAAGLSESGIALVGASKDNFVAVAANVEPTTSLLLDYNAEYTCTLQGADWFRENSQWAWGGDGRTIQLDIGLLLGNDPYIYPDNLPVVAAKGGPGGKPGCGSLPDPTKNFPVRQLVTNTGWGTGLDIRPNPGIGQYCYADYFRATRPMPLPPAIRQCLPGPAVGPQPELGLGTPPYGASLFGPGGAPLFPGLSPGNPESPAEEPFSDPQQDIATSSIPGDRP